jgi:hypothetical protein
MAEPAPKSRLAVIWAVVGLLLAGCGERTTPDLFAEGKKLLAIVESHKKTHGNYPGRLEDLAPQCETSEIRWRDWRYALEDGEPVLYSGPRNRTVCYRSPFGWHSMNTDPGGDHTRVPLR